MWSETLLAALRLRPKLCGRSGREEIDVLCLGGLISEESLIKGELGQLTSSSELALPEPCVPPALDIVPFSVLLPFFIPRDGLAGRELAILLANESNPLSGAVISLRSLNIETGLLRSTAEHIRFRELDSELDLFRATVSDPILFR